MIIYDDEEVARPDEEAEEAEEDIARYDVSEEWTEPDGAQWRSLMEFLKIEKEPEHIELSDLQGKEFVSFDQAQSFYYLYAKMMGFSVRKKLKRMDKNGVLCNRSWVCSNEGFREKKYYNRNDRVTEARALTRTGCKAEFRINLNRETNHWSTKCFNNHHNHKFALSIERPFLRSNRQFKGEIRELVLAMSRSGIKTSQIWNYMVEVHGGWDNVGCIKDDLYRGINKKYSTWEDCDTSTAMAFLEAKKGPHNTFFYKYDVDDENRLTNLFWSDGASQVDYQIFGDCLAFDSTYKTNRYFFFFD